MVKDQYSKLMLVTNKQDRPLETYLDFIEICAKSGITSVQLREKTLSDSALFEFGLALKSRLDPYHIPLIVNDNVQLAHELDAAGVHLGQTDGDILKARQVLGSSKIIGLSVDTEKQLCSANNYPIDYIGVGSIFPTKNKKDVATYWKLNGLRKLAQFNHYPIVAIGGINLNNALSVMQVGAAGIAAIGVFHDTDNPSKTTKALRQIVNG